MIMVIIVESRLIGVVALQKESVSCLSATLAGHTFT